MIGDCEKFIATETVQRVIFDLWNNAVIFSPDKRLFSDLNMNSFSGISKVSQITLNLNIFYSSFYIKYLDVLELLVSGIILRIFSAFRLGTRFK
jgi:hypothetical protein